MSKAIVTPKDLRDFALILQNNIEEFLSIKSAMDNKLNSYEWQDAVAAKFKSDFEQTKEPIDKLNAQMEEFIKYLDRKATVLEGEYLEDGSPNVSHNSMAYAAAGGAAVGVSAANAKVFTAKKVPSVEQYKYSFKKHGVFYLDNDGKIKTDRDKVIEAIDEVHGNNPKVEYKELDKGHHGYQQGNTIVMNETESNNGNILFNTYAHESQHIDQDEFCEVKENRNDPICKNIKDYKEPCDSNEWENNKKACDIKYKEYRDQIMETNAREAGANSEEAAIEYLSEYKQKIKKPIAFKR